MTPCAGSGETMRPPGFAECVAGPALTAALVGPREPGAFRVTRLGAMALIEALRCVFSIERAAQGGETHATLVVRLLRRRPEDGPGEPSSTIRASVEAVGGPSRQRVGLSEELLLIAPAHPGAQRFVGLTVPLREPAVLRDVLRELPNRPELAEDGLSEALALSVAALLKAALPSDWPRRGPADAAAPSIRAYPGMAVPRRAAVVCAAARPTSHAGSASEDPPRAAGHGLRALRRERLRGAYARLTDLEATGTRIAGVAEACGFRSPSSFIRAFKREFGITPGALRAGRGRR